jgi:hypothetical protein
MIYREATPEDLGPRNMMMFLEGLREVELGRAGVCPARTLETLTRMIASSDGRYHWVFEPRAVFRAPVYTDACVVCAARVPRILDGLPLGKDLQGLGPDGGCEDGLF